MSDNGFLETLACDFEENEPKMVLYIETLTGTAFEMMVSPLDSVLSIKNKIQHDEGIPINQQHLLLGDKELNNSAYLEEEGITGGSTLRLILGMRGGPISTRRATSRNEHLLWREIRDVVEATRDDMMTKVPPGSKITLLVYREGHTINLLKVIENNDGSYSTLSDTKKSTSGRSRFSVRNDVETQSERLRENAQTMTKLCELREKMEELNLRKKTKTQTPTEPAPSSPELSPVKSTCSDVPFTPPSHHMKKTEKQYKIKKYQSALAHLDSSTVEKSKSFSKNKVKQWLNSDYYDDPTMVPQKKSSRKLMKHSDEDTTKRHMYVNKILFGSDSSLEGFEDDDMYRHKKYKVKLSSQVKRISKSSKHFDECLGATSTFDEASNEAATVVQSRNDNISIGDKTSKILAEYYPDMSRSEFRQSIAHRKPLHDEASGSGELASSIAILEEEPEANVGNDEPNFTPPSGSISVPSPDANTFTISQIPREHVSTTTGTGSARNRIRVARLLIKDDERPKTSPHKFGRKVCEFLMNETDEGSGYVGAVSDSKSSKLRFKRTKCISISNLDKLSNSKVTSINAVCSWPRISSSKMKLNNDKLRITKMENSFSRELESRNSHKTSTLSGIHNKGFIENMETNRRPCTNALQIDTYDCKSKVDDFKSFSKITDNHPSIMIRSNSNFTHTPSTSTIEPLPPIEMKKPPRTRCKKCNKRLNITTIHTCRCGENFCSQHRYSEVHGCKYDYKTEGRKLIEQANPLVLAPKLPKI